MSTQQSTLSTSSKRSAQKRERYYLTQSRALVEYLSLNGDGTYNLRKKDGATTTIHPNFLIFVPAEKLNWFKHNG